MPRSIPGHGRVSARYPPPTSTGVPSSRMTSALMPGNGCVAEPGFVRVMPGSGVIRMCPVSVCHHVSTIGQRSPSDVEVVPHPRFRVDRLADRSQQPQRREVVLLGPLGAPAHERADRRRRRVEDRHAVALDDVPEAILVREVRRAFVHHHRRAVGERAVHDVAVARDPADVRRAPVDVVFLEIEHPLRRRIASGEIAAGRVHDALGFPRGAGRVEDVEHVLGIHRLGRAVRPRRGCIRS